MSSEAVYKIIPETEWPGVAGLAAWSGSALDQTDGYVHLSTRDQVAGTLARHFAGVSCRIAAFDAAGFGAALKWEPSRGGELFPHLYAALPVRAAATVIAAPWRGSAHDLSEFVP